MQATPRCKAISTAGVTFLRVKTEITKRILQEFAGKNLLTVFCQKQQNNSVKHPQTVFFTVF